MPWPDAEHFFEVAPTNADVEAVHEYCHQAPHYPGMTYEDGIRAVLDWLSGDADRPDQVE